ncbi:5-methylcytosine restriction system specificity protein McrC [Nocardia sp. AB354]|uniref:5-methylcytosine restriction system specificity protein McrC n=1 Tax=Nocardia sp. AB354 TaxID=3413283 RepID=UPI003C229291
MDSPRNRFIAITLTTAGRQVQSRKLSHRCAAASFTMQRLGVDPRTPTRAQLSADRLGRRDASDRRMLDAAHLVHDMALPTHQAGQQLVPTLIEDDHKYRILFEKAVRGYFRHTMGPAGWTVGSTHLTWPHTDGDSGADRLPRLETDTVLRHTATGRQIVIETKFTDALYESRSGTTKIDRNYLFQLYAYLMSQTGVGNPSADTAEGVLLFVAANGREPINDTVHIQGHRIRFLSVDLTETPDLIRRRWQLVVGSG